MYIKDKDEFLHKKKQNIFQIFKKAQLADNTQTFGPKKKKDGDYLRYSYIGKTDQFQEDKNFP